MIFSIIKARVKRKSLKILKEASITMKVLVDLYMEIHPDCMPQMKNLQR